MSMDFNKAVNGLNDTFDFLRDNVDLAKAAETKAERLEDGTEVGGLKASVVRALDLKRRYILAIGLLQSQRGTFAGASEEDFKREMSRYLLELQLVERNLDTAIKQLDKLGVRTKLVKR